MLGERLRQIRKENNLTNKILEIKCFQRSHWQSILIHMKKFTNILDTLSISSSKNKGDCHFPEY